MDKINMRKILSETVSALAKSSFSFKEELKIEGLIGITIDKTDIILININECYTPKELENSEKNSSLPNKKNTENENSSKFETRDTKVENTDFSSQKTQMHKILSETSHKECLQEDENSYTEVQKSIKVVQRPEGVVQQKEVEWKKFTTEGELLEQRKVENLQPVDSEIHTSNFEDQNFDDEHPIRDYSPYHEDYQNYVSEDYNDDYNYDVDYSYSTSQDQRSFQRGFSKRGIFRGKRQTQAPNDSEQFKKRMKGNFSNNKPPRGRKSQFQHFPYTKVVLEKPEESVNFRGGRKSTASTKNKSNIQPNDIIFNNALNLVWQGKMTVDSAIEMFNLPESRFKKELTSNKSQYKNFSSKSKGKTASNMNMMGSWKWGDEDEDHEGGGYDAY